MNLAMALPVTTYSTLDGDRSLGTEGHTLRRELMSARNAATVHRADDVLNRLTEALHRADEREGLRIAADVFSRALTFLESIPQDLPLPHVIVESENEVGLDWDEGTRSVLGLTIDGTEMAGYSALLGKNPHYGKVDITAGFPDTLRFLLARIYPRRVSR